MAAMMAFEVQRPVLGGLLLAGGIASKLVPASTVYTVLILIATWYAARLDVDPRGACGSG